MYNDVNPKYNSVTVAGENGTGHFRLEPETASYVAKGKKVVLSITEYVEES